MPTLLAAVGALLLGACGERPPPGKVYAMPQARVATVLGKVEVPLWVFGSGALDETVDTSDPARIVWTVRDPDRPILRYVAALHPVDAGSTRVAMTLEGADPAIARRLDANPSIRTLYQVAMGERVAATLERREMDLSKIFLASTAATVANADTLRADLDPDANRRAAEAGRTTARADAEE